MELFCNALLCIAHLLFNTHDIFYLKPCSHSAVQSYKSYLNFDVLIYGSEKRFYMLVVDIKVNKAERVSVY